MPEVTVYSDFDVNLGLHPVTKDVVKKTNLESVRQSLRLLLLTVFYDRKWQPEIGCNLNRLLFGQLSDFVLYNTAEELKRLIGLWEPRVNIQELTVERSSTNDFVVVVRIVYSIVWLGLTDTFVYTINKVR